MNARKSITGLIILVGPLILVGCQRQSEASKRIQPVYDQKTGKLQLLKYDSNEDGKIDRWEYYGPNQQLEKVGFSRSGDGKEDAWSFPGPGGSTERIEISTHRDGKVTRTEHYKDGRIASAEEDVDGDGKIDKWETYDGDHLASVAFDTLHRGTPDRRLIYGTDGTARLEVDLAGDGHFKAADESRAAHPRR